MAILVGQEISRRYRRPRFSVDRNGVEVFEDAVPIPDLDSERKGE
jgi:hypothetical protein